MIKFTESDRIKFEMVKVLSKIVDELKPVTTDLEKHNLSLPVWGIMKAITITINKTLKEIDKTPPESA